MNYYDQTIATIVKLIDDDQLNDALALLNEELSMPYIPAKAQQKFEALKAEIHTKQSEKTTPNHQMDLSMIESYLFDEDPDRQDYALAMLEKANARQYMDCIKRYLVEPDGDATVKTALLHILLSQQIQGVLDVVKNYTTIQVDLSLLQPLDKENTFYRQLCIWIETLFQDNASLVHLFTQWAWDMLVSIYPIMLSSETDIDLLMHQLIDIAVSQYDMDESELEKRYEIVKKAHKIN